MCVFSSIEYEGSTLTCRDFAFDWLKDSSYTPYNSLGEACFQESASFQNYASKCCTDGASGCSAFDFSCIDSWTCAGPLDVFDSCNQATDEYICDTCFNGGEATATRCFDRMDLRC
jgi:hypothetical protein